MRTFVFSLPLFLALGGCSGTTGEPTYMPSGYTYHHDVYKAPPGPEVSQDRKTEVE